MLNNEIFVKGLAGMNAAFPNSKLDLEKETLEVWYRALSDITDEMYQTAILSIIRSKKFFPTIAEIRQTAYALCVPGHTKTGEDAWAEVMERIKAVGWCGDPKFTDGITAKAVESMGWHELCNTEINNLGTVRAQFIRIYNSFKDRAKENAELWAVNPDYAKMIEQTSDRVKLLPE